ncbi:MAG: hypothetical protein AUI21_03610 [Nitrospirae bacterium 13_1_40CM_2_62_10]|nr:MAG: hypothetical protein AUI21_03610 [Nitrospirae bacterium 13_1_40CM_2_62_10]
MKDKVPAVGGRCDGQPDKPVARKELKRPTPNFIRFTELTQALLLVSAGFFIDLYWPVRSVTLPSWAWVPSVIIWACTIVVVVARLTLPSFRDQAVILRTRVLALWVARSPVPWLFVATCGVFLAIGTYVAYPLASSIDGGVGLAVHYFGLFAMVTAISLVSLRFYESACRPALLER